MLTRIVLALLLLLPSAAFAQELDKAISAMVRISGTRNGTPVRGTGFVVGLDRDKAMIVTAAHVIEGVQQIEVTFAVNTTERFSVDSVLGMDSGNPHGLAIFQVRGALPAGVTTLSFETGIRPSYGTELFLVGFPLMELAPRTPRRTLSGRRGTLLLIDQGIGEGFSGGPVLQDGKVVGVVTDVDEQTTYAVSAVVAREALEGWGVKLGGQSSTPASSTSGRAKQVTPDGTAAAPPPALPTGSTETAAQKALYDASYNNYLKGNYDSAMRGFQEFLIASPGSSLADNAAYWIGECFYRQRRYREAIERFEEVLNRYPQSEKLPSARLKQGYAYLELGERSQGVLQLQSVIRHDPKSDEANLARLRLRELGIRQ